MFDSNEFDDDEFFKGRVHPVTISRGPNMSLLMWLLAVVVLAILLTIILRCCCRRGNSTGRVIAPPPRDESAPAPYPQQQYVTPLYPACPPSYDQVMSSEQHKQPPYNPHAPH